jgi:ferredoxin
MRIEIDQNHCQGHALCFATAPEVVDLDEQGYASVRPEVTDVLPELAQRLVSDCPEKAISVRE